MDSRVGFFFKVKTSCIQVRGSSLPSLAVPTQSVRKSSKLKIENEPSKSKPRRNKQQTSKLETELPKHLQDDYFSKETKIKKLITSNDKTGNDGKLTIFPIYLNH
jgi:hypothetical protein